MSSVPIPSKGDIVTIENKQYRVLKVSGTVVEVLAMYDASTSQKFNATSKTVNFSGGATGQQYQGSDIDTYLNETFFATLSATMQAAIVPKAINQDMWDYSNGVPSSVTYYHLTYGSNNYYFYDRNYGTAEVGSRNVYALSFRDVLDYLGVVANGDFSDTDIWQMFWNKSTSVSEVSWLRSARSMFSKAVFAVDGYNGSLASFDFNRSFTVQSVFQIDWDILYPSTPTLTFKHFYDAGTIGSGTVKFRHYSQQEPSSGETWVLNDSLTDTTGETGFLVKVNFTSNSAAFTKITLRTQVGREGVQIDYDTTTVYDSLRGSGWSDQAYRTIIFTETVTDTTLLTWLQANGTKQGGGQVTPKLTKGTWRWLTPYDMGYETLKDCENNTTVTEFTSGGKTFTGFEYDARTGRVAYSSDTEHVDVIVPVDNYFNETYKDITVTQDFDLEEYDFLYMAISMELLTKLS